MRRTVAVLHGVGNRERPAFEATVSRLMTAIGADARIIPVFWGDLGAGAEGLDAAIPDAGVRADPGEWYPELGLTLLDCGGAEVRADSAQAVAESFESAMATEVQATDVEDMRREIVATWPTLRHLVGVGDEEVLRAIGRSLAQATAGLTVDGPSAGIEVRALAPDPRRALRHALRALDHAVGAVLGAAGGGLNTFLRRSVAPGVGRFLGDVLVYQRHREDIHKRVWTTIRDVDPLLGSKERPVDLFGHSLGGVIGFDMAAASQPPLWINRLLTFGSQSPFLHVLDPRGAPLLRYAGAPLVLAPSIAHWTNLWEPFDPLAFVAARVFELHSGELPDDRAVKHLASFGLWTHSAYWEADDLVRAGRELLASG